LLGHFSRCPPSRFAGGGRAGPCWLCCFRGC